MLNVNRQISYRNFGYIPKGIFLKDLFGKLFGHRNLIKRLQARDIMNLLAVKPHEEVLDFGCGSGHFTVEIAKQASKAIGIDIAPEVKEIKVPPILNNKLEFVQTEGGNLPFQDSSFDTILASEIIATVEDPVWFLNEFKRVLKPGGRLVICNGAGHPFIEEAYNQKNEFYQMMRKRFSKTIPTDYEDYCSILNRSFGNAIERFYKLKDVDKLLTDNEFSKEESDFSPGYIAGSYFSKSQFIHYLKTGETHSHQSFVVKYLWFNLIRKFEKKKYEGGVLYAAINKK